MTERRLVAGNDSYINITDNRFKEWQAAFPDIDIDEELSKANAWLSRNKGKRWKTLRGFEVWLQRAQDNAPRRREDQKTKGQLSHLEQVQREHERIQREYENAPRLSEEVVGEMLRQLGESLPVIEREESKRVDQLRCEHEFKQSIFGGGQWCGKCGLFKDQWFCLRMDIPSNNLHRECHCGSYR